MIGKILSLIIKEFYATLQDKRARISLLVPPIIQLLIFSNAATLDVKNISIGVLNEDYGKYSTELISRFQGSSFFKHITYFTHQNEIQRAIDNQDVTMVVHLDQDFSKNVILGDVASVQLLLDGRKSNSSQIVMGYTTQVIDQFNAQLNRDLNRKSPGSVLVNRYWFNPNLAYKWFTVPGLVGVLTMLITLIVTANSVAREKEMGTFEQLLVTPLRPIEILIGKTVPAIFVGLAEGTFMLLAAIFIFQIPFTGSFIHLYLGLFVFILSIAGVGLFISSFAQTQQQVLLGVFLFVSPAIALSGFATPIENMPEWLQIVTLANPLRFILLILRGSFLKGLPLEIILENIYPMAIIAAFTLSLATWLFKKRIA